MPVPLPPKKLPQPSPPDPQEEAPPKCNDHVPSLADQFKESLPSTTNQPPQPTIDMDLEQPCDLNVPKPNPYRSDRDLGDLDFRFDPKRGWFATDKEIASLNSLLVVVDRENNVEHHLHSSRAELYLADDLRNRDHYYENGPELPNFQTNNVRTIHYTQGCNDFTKDLCVLQSNSVLFIDAFQDLKFCVPDVIKFVLSYGERNLLCDGELKNPATSNRLESDDAGREPMDEPVQRRHLMFGCCGQNFSEEYVDSGSGKDVTYGFGMFEKEDDATFRTLVKQMLADVFDMMQMCEDEIETLELKNLLPFNHKGHDKLFAKYVWKALGALLTRREEFTIQVKNLSQWKRVWRHKDGFNCVWNGYTKTLTLCFTWVDALDVDELTLTLTLMCKYGHCDRGFTLIFLPFSTKTCFLVRNVLYLWDFWSQ
jgi:hypothetical protein